MRKQNDYNNYNYAKFNTCCSLLCIQRLFATVRVFVALWVGAVILVSNFGYGWYTDTVRVHTQYRAFTTEEIEADVGLHIGLLGVNITLKGTQLYTTINKMIQSNHYLIIYHFVTR